MARSSAAHRIPYASIEAFRSEIVAEWRSAAHGMAATARLTPTALLDRVPAMLDQIGELAGHLEADDASRVDRESIVLDIARRHALERAREGFTLTDLVTELGLLRSSITTVWDRAHAIASERVLRSMHLAIDRAIAASVVCYAEAAKRREAVDRRRMEEELRLALRSRDDVLAIVSHDLRNPLGAIDLTASLVLSNADADGRTRKHVDLIRKAARSAKRLIQDLLDSAIMQAGRFQITTRGESAVALVDEALERHESLAAEQGVALVRAADIGAVGVECDRERVLQVFGNLVANAVKFCRAGDTITIGAELADRAVRFSVADTGPGIDPDRVKHLFEPYWSAPEHVACGTGLGLYIAKGIVDAHGGRIWVESKPGAGARFFFTLPTSA